MHHRRMIVNALPMDTSIHRQECGRHFHMMNVWATVVPPLNVAVFRELASLSGQVLSQAVGAHKVRIVSDYHKRCMVIRARS